jgi:hypothetical protein
MEESTTLNHGIQPIDALLTELGVGNHDLVAASTEQLTHKQVQKARKGRQLSPNLQRKVLNALQKAAGNERTFSLTELFTYRG